MACSTAAIATATHHTSKVMLGKRVDTSGNQNLYANPQEMQGMPLAYEE
jgi:hypothetical protein